MPLSRLLLSAAIVIAPALDAGAQRAAPDAAPIERAQLIGAWRLDSLAVYPLRGSADSLPDSTRAVLANYERIIRGAVARVRSGERTITTRYLDDSTFVHDVTPKGVPRPTRERGRWSFDVTAARLRCRTAAGGTCPHDRARVERASADELILRLELTGRGTGIGEYFRLVRVATER
jgi:hypothetical protein